MIAVFDLQNLFSKAIFFKIILASSCLESCYRVGIILASSWTVAGRATPTSSCHFSLIILPSRKRGPEIVIILASSYMFAIRVDIDHCDHPGVILVSGRRDISLSYAYYLWDTPWSRMIKNIANIAILRFDVAKSIVIAVIMRFAKVRNFVNIVISPSGTAETFANIVVLRSKTMKHIVNITYL